MATVTLTAANFEQTISRDGILVFSQPGALPAPALEQVITAVTALDMTEVRSQVAAAAQEKEGTAPTPK
jgi:thioredoxin 1